MQKKVYAFCTMLIFIMANTAYSASIRYEIGENGITTEKSTTVKNTVMAVLHTHKGLKSIQENRQAAIYEVTRAKTGYGPRLDAVGSIGWSNTSDETTRPVGEDSYMYGAGTAGLTLTQPLWDGFLTRSRVRASEATLDSVSSRVIDNATTLALDGLIAHIDLIWRRETLTLAEKNVKTHERILTSTSARQAMGTDTLANVTQTQGRLTRAVSTQAEAQSSLIQGEDYYKRLTELPIPTHLAPVQQPLDMFQNVHDVIHYAKTNNPKVVAYLADVRTAQAEVEVAQSTYSPVINLEASANYSDEQTPSEEWVMGYDVMATMRWNLFNSGADVAADKAAAARVREARQTAMNALDEVTLEIQNTWTQYQNSIRQLTLHQKAINYNVKTRDFYMEQFLLGQRTLLDVLDAESELFTSSTSALTARANIIITTYRLYALAGVLLSELQIAENPLLESTH